MHVKVFENTKVFDPEKEPFTQFSFPFSFASILCLHIEYICTTTVFWSVLSGDVYFYLVIVQRLNTEYIEVQAPRAKHDITWVSIDWCQI